MTELTQDEITEMALHDMLEHDLFDVEFCWGNSRQWLGFVSYKRDKLDNLIPKRIELSSFYFDAVVDKWEMVDVWLHELAHAKSVLDHGEKAHGHGKIWRDYCIKLGAEPTRCADSSNIDQWAYKYTGYCPNDECDKEYGFSRLGKLWKRNWMALPNGYRCPHCDLLLKVSKNY
jgi:predicted SprT family Zn-dependent metalloprotease